MFPNWFQEWLVRIDVRDQYETVLLANLTLGQEDEDFVTFAKQALHLIEITDPRRYRRVVREVRYLVNIYLDSVADYSHGIRRCSLDFERFKVSPSDPRYEWNLAWAACVIVHEATHGRLCSLGIPYNKRTWARVERICHGEETRFAARLRSERYDFTKLVPPLRKHAGTSCEISPIVRGLRCL